MSKLIMIVLLVAILLLNILLGWFVYSHSQAFFSSPLTYGTQGYGIVLCSCQTESGKELYFNSTTTWIINRNQPIDKINMTLIQELVR